MNTDHNSQRRHSSLTVSTVGTLVTLALAILALGFPSTLLASPEPLQPCVFGERAPQAPAELDQFNFLIGNWDIETISRNQDGTWNESGQAAYWEGRWILGGTAISDYWYNSPPTGEGDPPGRGMNVRFFRRDLGPKGQWLNMWQHSRLSEVRTLLSEVRNDGLMHMWATSPDTSNQRRMHFVVEPDEAWRRVEERSFDGGESWVEVARIHATRASCPWQPPS